ncbi:MAG TPA: hypothetical protein VGG85_20445 [Terracidiphilus sp.]|jgi:hypothetical protein
MNDTLGVQHPFIQLRDEQLSKLAALASDRRQAESILATIRALDKSIMADGSGGGKYSKHKSAIHAILDYPDEMGRPMPREQIVKALQAGKFRGGGKGSDTIIRKSVGSFLGAGRGSVSKQIREHNRLVGRGEWPDERFQ